MDVHLDHKTIRTNQINLHVVFAGPPDGKPIVLLHGFPEFWYGWRKQIGPLAEAGYRVIVPDQRGYNLSDKPLRVDAYHIDILARDVIGLIDAVGCEEAFVVGHDWGAAVAWHLATYYPKRVGKLGILNVPHPNVMIRTLRKSFSQLRKSWYIFFFQIPWLPEWVLGRKNALGLRGLLIRSGKRKTFSEGDFHSYQGAWTQPDALTAMINWYRSAFRNGIKYAFKPPSSLPRIQVPTLMLWGVKDVALGVGMAQPSIDLCVNGELIFFEDATHWVQHDKPDTVTRYLLDFFRDS